MDWKKCKDAASRCRHASSTTLLIHLMDPCTCANTKLQVAAFGELQSAAIRMLAITLVIQKALKDSNFMDK
ncbi:hypothetical protein CY35_09G049200 [Sphagnum magellanicum]|nr:hypothetical protein CY35_09G049200 [Sphagnum magellanicum]